MFNDAYECPRCQIGQCRAEASTYTRVLNGHVINVPNMKVYTCDVCGLREYEHETLVQLQALLGAAQHTRGDDESRLVAKSAQAEARHAKNPRPKP